MAKKTKRTFIKETFEAQKSDEEQYIQLVNDYIILCDKVIKMKKDIEERRMACSAALARNNLTMSRANE